MSDIVFADFDDGSGCTVNYGFSREGWQNIVDAAIAQGYAKPPAGAVGSQPSPDTAAALERVIDKLIMRGS